MKQLHSATASAATSIAKAASATSSDVYTMSLSIDSMAASDSLSRSSPYSTSVRSSARSAIPNILSVPSIITFSLPVER